MKILQINTKVNTGSTGRIAEEIGEIMMTSGHTSAIAFGRGNRSSKSKKIRIGNKWNFYNHVIQTRLLDNHGFASKQATQKLIQKIDSYEPDVVGLHNLHGYFIHVGILFEYLKANQVPLIWTFHDCWPFTGHCSYFERVDCQKWKTHCEECPLTQYYPQSWFIDRSFRNFEEKKKAFTGHSNLTIVTPSQWLKDLVKKSFFQEYRVEVIHNGIDLQSFRPMDETWKKKFVLGVANEWTERKGLADFKELRKILNSNTEIVLIGLNEKQISILPEGIKGIQRTESVEELARWYSRSAVFVNPTYIDNFPTTNLEALACGTPVITYDTGGSPEAIDENTGVVIPKGDIKSLNLAISDVMQSDRESLKDKCRQRAVKKFNKHDRYNDYLELYKKILA